MKSLLPLILLLTAPPHLGAATPQMAALSAPEVGSWQPIDARLRQRLLAPDVWLVQDPTFYDTNVLVARLPGDVAVIASSFIDTPRTEVLLKWIKVTLKPKEIRAINTHFHFDGTGGNEAYTKAGVKTWTTAETAALYAKRAASMRTSLSEDLKDKSEQKALLETKTQKASETFAAQDGLKWTFGDQTVEVFYPGPAHSPDNLVVYLPKSKVLFGGCMVRPLSMDLGNTADADLKAYETSARALKKFAAQIVIPGHGDLGGPDLIDHTIQLAAAAKQTAKK